MELKGFLGTGLHAERLTVTQIALQGLFDVLMKEHGAKGTAGETLITGYALFLVKLDNTIFPVNRVSGTSFAALGNTALFADDGHTDNRMGIKDHDPHPAFLGIVDTLAPYTAGQLTDLAAGTSFGDYCQMHRFLQVVFTKGCYLSETPCFDQRKGLEGGPEARE